MFILQNIMQKQEWKTTIIHNNGNEPHKLSYKNRHKEYIVYNSIDIKKLKLIYSIKIQDSKYLLYM